MYNFDPEKHLHTLDGIPLMGTSTVVGVIAKPLTWWASGLAVKEFGWSPVKDRDKKKIPIDIRLPIAASKFAEIKELSDVAYLQLLDKAYRAHYDNLDRTAVVGTDRHSALEGYVRHIIEEYSGIPMATLGEHESVQLFSEWAVANVSKFLVSESHCYSRRLWTGGIVDLLFLDIQGRTAIMDFKSSREAYLSQFFQIAGYDIAISENGVFNSEGDLIYKTDKTIEYYSVFPFGMEKPTPQFHFEVEEARRGFEAAVVLHKIITGGI